MFLLASQAFDLSGKAVLHIVHREEVKNPNVSQFIARVKCEISQIIHIGEHLLSEPRFQHFDTVIIHDCSYGHIRDYYNKLKSGNWVKRFIATAKSSKKQLVVVGAALNLVGPKLSIIPFITRSTQKVAICKPKIDRNRIDIYSTGLNIFRGVRFDFNFTFKAPIAEYMREIQAAGREMPIYCLDNRAVLDGTGDVRRGTVYLLDGSKYKSISRPEFKLTQQQLDQENTREISAGKVSDIEKKMETVTQEGGSNVAQAKPDAAE